ncbi:MAG: hypothetical protein Q8830_03405, partial [Candidatus Phytoplasma australasiaticum]|nr:hypothetical protein [Candidatus Phytoplasma australasiaticum]
MLLNHPFINNINANKMDDDGLIYKCTWISMEHLFSTTSRYYADHQYGSSRESNTNISFSETSNMATEHTTNHQDSLVGIWDLINFFNNISQVILESVNHFSVYQIFQAK